MKTTHGMMHLLLLTIIATPNNALHHPVLKPLNVIYEEELVLLSLVSRLSPAGEGLAARLGVAIVTVLPRYRSQVGECNVKGRQSFA